MEDRANSVSMQQPKKKKKKKKNPATDRTKKNKTKFRIFIKKELKPFSATYTKPIQIDKFGFKIITRL